MSSDATTPDLRAQALNPETPLEELLTLAEDYPNEVLRNPVFDLLLVEDPGFLSRMSGAAQLAILKADGCPEFVRSLFAIGKITVWALEGYEGESHFYDYTLDDKVVRLKGVAGGWEWSELILSPTLVPYFVGTLQDEVENGYGEHPSTTSFLSAVHHHSEQTEIGDSGKDKRYFIPPTGADEGTVFLDGKEYTIYRDPKDRDWKRQDASKIKDLKAIAEHFFPAYDEGELDYQDEYDDNVRRPWEYDHVEGFELCCKAGQGSVEFVEASEDELLELTWQLPVAAPEAIGVLVHTPLGVCGDYGLFEEIEQPEDIDEVADLDELRSRIEEEETWAEEVVETFSRFGQQLLANICILGVEDPGLVKVLVRPSDSPELFASLHYCGGQSFASGSVEEEDVRFRLDGNEWIALTTLLEAIGETGVWRDRLLFSVATADIEFNFCAPAQTTYIKGSLGCEFSAAVDLDLELIQCLPLMENEHVCILQGYDHGEFETGIMNCGFSGGGYTYTHRSLEGTVWEGLGLEPAKP